MQCSSQSCTIICHRWHNKNIFKTKLFYFGAMPPKEFGCPLVDHIPFFQWFIGARIMNIETKQVRKLHDMSFQVRRNGPTGKNAPKGVSPEELAAQKKRYEEKRSELESAQNYRYWTSWTMFVFGLVLTVGGLFVNKLAGS